MNYSKLEAALEAVLPGGVYKLNAPDSREIGTDLTRYIVWTPTGSRALYAEGCGAVRIGQAVVTVCTQTEGDDLPEQVISALQQARVAVGPPAQELAENECTWYTDLPVEVI